MLIPTFSPQGDGNQLPGTDAQGHSLTVDPYLFPARGRKPFSEGKTGPGTPLEVDPYLFPARGRKLAKDSLLGLWLEWVDPYLFPARGRKRKEVPRQDE